ncbi:signal transduction histidine kinase [Gemmobacter caeni]|uniref:histidine kinase n=2 Tax=Gemmobacter TaxID=204456 RepID=A0A2T6AYM7_9RHOB|nr:histidine kinase [Gemmobacter caeni]TWI99094.1 signal transduction histidine kinase [Gemmobacter caeni]GHC32205.1 hypothetical protein GCM10007291_36520 [Gemmobacter nanjingensis]
MSEVSAYRSNGIRAESRVSGQLGTLWTRLRAGQTDEDRLKRQLLDYAEVGQRLFWQRQMIFGVALLLAGFFYSLPLAVLNLVMVAICETYDYRVFISIARARARGQQPGRRHYWSIVLGTIMSSGAISFFAVWISILQGQGSHFMPMFFLFAAGVFAAMNNHHLLSILALRLGIYGVTFFAIPIRDIVLAVGGIGSDLWVQFLSSLFVAYFIIDCSRIFLAMYRTNMERLIELEVQNRKIEAALAAKSAFLSTMSHELRTPLTSISASLDLALSGNLGAVDPAPRKVLEIAQRNSKTLKSLIDEVLDLQKASAGKLTLELHQTDLVALVQESVDVNQPYAGRLGCVIEFVRPEETLTATVDSQRIKQALSNILSNAAKFSPPDSNIEVSIGVHDGAALIEVRDQGEGLDEARKDEVFEPFTQLDSGDGRKAGGTGLGLSITKQIVEAHGGHIDYRRSPVRGTIFSVTLPLKTEAGGV